MAAEPGLPLGEAALFLFNALWFRPDGGREGYLAYVAATDPILRGHGRTLRAAVSPRARRAATTRAAA